MKYADTVKIIFKSTFSDSFVFLTFPFLPILFCSLPLMFLLFGWVFFFFSFPLRYSVSCILNLNPPFLQQLAVIYFQEKHHDKHSCLSSLPS